MATTLVGVETREVARCEYCRLMQYRTSNGLCRRCHKPLDIEEPVRLAPQLVPSQVTPSCEEAGLQVATQVREIRRARHLSQRQLAGRMQVPRTYISKIENGKAIPTLGSLERLAAALGVEMSQLVRDAAQPSRRRGRGHFCGPVSGRDCRPAASVGPAATDPVLRRSTGCRSGPQAHGVGALAVFYSSRFRASGRIWGSCCRALATVSVGAIPGPQVRGILHLTD